MGLVSPGTGTFRRTRVEGSRRSRKRCVSVPTYRSRGSGVDSSCFRFPHRRPRRGASPPETAGDGTDWHR